jgi:hypothetical protein
VGKTAELYKLDDHIRDNEYQFRKLEDKMDQVAQRLDRIEQLVLEIKDSFKR